MHLQNLIKRSAKGYGGGKERERKQSVKKGICSPASQLIRRRQDLTSLSHSFEASRRQESLHSALLREGTADSMHILSITVHFINCQPATAHSKRCFIL